MAALEASEVLALELDLLDPDVRERLIKAATARPDERLPAPLAARVERRMAAECVDAAQYRAFVPEFQVASLAVMAARREGFDPSYAIDLVLALIARDFGKASTSLETPEVQIAALRMPTREATIEFVTSGLDELDTGKSGALLTHMASAWTDGNLADLEAYERWCGCLGTAAERAAMKRLLDDRNPRLATAIDALHTGGRSVFAAVGSLHMIGPRGLPALLRERGYVVEQVRYRPLIRPPRAGALGRQSAKPRGDTMSDTSALGKMVPGFDFLQSLVKSSGSALPGIGQWIAPTLDPAELDKRIGELRTVQYWLEQNARMLAATIQALEVQRMTLSTLKSMNVKMGRTRRVAEDPIKAFMADPINFIASIGPESLVQNAPGLVAGAVVPGGAVAKAATMGAGSFATDYGSSLLDALGKQGVDINDPAALAAAAKNTPLMQRAAAQAMAHASVVGTVDALSGGMASKVALPAKAFIKQPLAREIANLATQTPIQGALGGLGEAGGELAAGQPLAPATSWPRWSAKRSPHRQRSRLSPADVCASAWPRLATRRRTLSHSRTWPKPRRRASCARATPKRSRR